MLRGLLCTVLLTAVVHNTHAISTSGDNIAKIRDFFGLSNNKPAPVWRDIFQKVVNFIESYLPVGTIQTFRQQSQARTQAEPDIPGPEFRWIPLYQGSARLETPVTLPSAPCFQSVSVRVENFSITGATLTFTVGNATSLLCSDFYMIGTLENFQLATFFTSGDHVVQWTFRDTVKPSELSDIKRNGFRVFRFLDNEVAVLYQLYETVQLFLPALTNSQVPASCEAQNVAFLNRTVQINLQPRSTNVVSIDESSIKSGDMFGVLRLDGLDPMLAWAMGAHTGHTTIALRVPGQGLHVCESTTNSSYWPTNGIQCTPWSQWVQQISNASLNVVHLPLRADRAAMFNETAAWEWFQQNEGNDYGYGNILYGWQDNEGNYMYPLTAEAHSLLPGLVGHVYAPAADLIWLRGLNLRVGTQGLDAPDVMEAAFEKFGWDWRQLHWAEEQDSWLYEMKHNDGSTVHAPSMVCNVFVCSMWKASGMFADQPDFQCTETTNWDIETLAIFDQTTPRPPQCVAADPDLPFCQIAGNWRVELPFYNSRWPIPPNAFNNCPRGDSPDYNKPYPC